MRNLLRNITGSWWAYEYYYNGISEIRPTVGYIEYDGVVRWHEWEENGHCGTVRPRLYTDSDETIEWLRAAIAGDAEDSARGAP